ncbi:MAG TPA: IS1595 family transposase [Gaiellaceae bacterium]
MSERVLKLQDPIFSDPDAAREYLEQLRWPDGKPVCPHCGQSERECYPLKGKSVRPGLWKCPACRKQFTVTVGTIFQGSHIKLNVWLLAFHLLCSSKKGFSALQLSRNLGVSLKTAWHMAHRIRWAMAEPSFADQLTGTVEADETYVGGKARRPNKKPFAPLNPNVPDRRRKKTGRGTDKTPVMLLVERGGRARSFRVANVTAETLGGQIRIHVDPSAHLRTDSFKSYIKVGREYASHETVDHNYEYVRGDAHTNTAENYFSILKRGINGVYHHVSPEHLPRYLAEFDFRYNARHLTDTERTNLALSQTEGKRLMYRDSR